MPFRWLIIFILSPIVTSAQKTYPADTTVLAFGFDTIRIERIRYSLAPWVWLNLHENEYISVLAADSQLRQQPAGIRIRLLQCRERYLMFQEKGVVYQADPNRIFTDAGLEENLKLLNPQGVPPLIRSRIRRLRTVLIQMIGRPRLLIALHNNTPDNYSVLGYVKNPHYRTRLAPGADPDDFVLTTSPQWYHRLIKVPLNLSLEKNTAPNDGSFSVYARLRKLPYLNIEAEETHLDAQLYLIKQVQAYRP